MLPFPLLEYLLNVWNVGFCWNAEMVDIWNLGMVECRKFWNWENCNLGIFAMWECLQRQECWNTGNPISGILCWCTQRNETPASCQIMRIMIVFVIFCLF